LTFHSELIFVRILFPYVTGLCFGYLFLGEEGMLLCWLITLLLFTGLIVVNVFYQSLKAYNFKAKTGLWLIAFWFTFGSLNALTNTTKNKESYYGKKSLSHLKGWIGTEPQLSSGMLRFEMTVNSGYHQYKPQDVSGKLLVVLKIDEQSPIQLKYGSEILISATHMPIDPPYNPAEFNFKARLANKNIYHQAFITQRQMIVLHNNVGNPIIAYALKVRKSQVDIYRKLVKNDEAFAVASTLVLGYRADLSDETLSAYSSTGTIHALSVSGMHVGVIYLFLNWALFFFDRNNFFKVLKVLLICSLIWYYSLLTGFSASVLRSAVMLTVYILAKALKKNSNSYNILAFTAMSLLWFDPFLIWDFGFQLSFLAVFGLIYLQPKIYNWFDLKNKWLDKLWSTVALSLAAQITTFPLSIYYFHQFPIYFIFSNLFILLPLTAMMYLGIGILVFRIHFLSPLFEWIINFTNSGLKWISNLPFSGITGIWITEWEFLFLSLSLGLLTIALAKYKKKLLFASVLSILIFQSFSTHRHLKLIGQRKVLFFSLRKNYAVAFIEGKNAVVITDLAITNKKYDFFVKPALAQLQLNKIDFLDWEKDTTINNFSKKEHQVYFGGYAMLLLDGRFDNKKIGGLPKFETIWIHHNPKKSIIELRNEVVFSTIVMDATNRDYLIKKHELEANKINVHAYTLKKNKAYLINLNK
jgi:competence protein ComEC